MSGQYQQYSYGEQAKKVFGKGKLEVWGGAITNWADANPDVVIDLTGKLLPSEVSVLSLHGFEEEPSWAKLARSPRLISIGWPDMGVPPLPKKFWEELAAWLKKEGGVVYVGCTGGRGRTGSALAILGGLIKGWKRPIKAIRERYSQDAVETESQVRYVQMVTGTSERVEGSYTFRYGTSTPWTTEAATSVREVIAKVVKRVNGAKEAIDKGWIAIEEDEEYDEVMIAGPVGCIKVTRYRGGQYGIEDMCGNDPKTYTHKPDFKLENWFRREVKIGQLLEAAGEDPREGWTGYEIAGLRVNEFGLILAGSTSLTLDEAKAIVAKEFGGVE